MRIDGQCNIRKISQALINTAGNIVSSTVQEISAIILAGDYPQLSQQEIGQINYWLRKKFGARFQCQNRKEANRLIKTISAWTRHHQRDLQTYIDSEIWQGQQIDAIVFQRQVLTKEFKRNPLRRQAHKIKKMLSEMINLFCPQRQSPTESTFEKNKLRNFIASSRLEGIYLEND